MNTENTIIDMSRIIEGQNILINNLNEEIRSLKQVEIIKSNDKFPAWKNWNWPYYTPAKPRSEK